MTFETLKDRIEKAEQKIQRKQNTIEKKTARVAKLTAELEKTTGEHERYCIECDIGWLEDDLKRLASEIKETEKTLENYRAQMAGEIKRENVLIHEVPETLKRLRDELVERWDGYDKERRERLIKAYKELGYSEFTRQYGFHSMDDRYETDEHIHERNERSADSQVIDLIYRVRDVVGEITDWSDIRTDGLELNGFVSGKEGRCKVETIGAGGYNIQRFHYRVLVKKID